MAAKDLGTQSSLMLWRRLIIADIGRNQALLIDQVVLDLFDQQLSTFMSLTSHHHSLL